MKISINKFLCFAWIVIWGLLLLSNQHVDATIEHTLTFKENLTIIIMLIFPVFIGYMAGKEK